MALEFEWDLRKAELNVSKHGVTFDEAKQVFADAAARMIVDPLHSSGDLRFIALGRNESEKMLVVVFTDRGEKVRIISA